MRKSTKADSFEDKSMVSSVFLIRSQAVLCKMLLPKSIVFCLVVDIVSEAFLD